MSDLITIGGVSVSINDPCAVLTELRKAQITIATGEAVAMTRFDNDEVRFNPANSAKLDDLIAKYEGLCAKAQGRGTRRARGIRWR